MIVVVVAIWQAYDISKRSAFASLQDNGEERLNLYVSTLSSALGKFQYLPFILRYNNTVVDLLTHKGSALVVNRELEVINSRAGSDVLYILDVNGITTASSNWQTKSSFVGNDYSFRPYFINALNGEQSGFFAIGVTTGEPGYFISAPITAQGKIVGVAVVKVKLEALQLDWANGGETVFVSDRNGIIFLSSDKAWIYKSLAKLSPDTLKNVEAERQYDGVVLRQLPIRYLTKKRKDLIVINGEQFFTQSRALPELGWSMHFLSPLKPVDDIIFNAVAWTSSLAVFIIIVLMVLRERRLKLLNQKMAMEADIFRTLNKKLKEEVHKHQQTEKELRAAQEEIVQANKLAAMGQMSTAIAHELNQPITAIRTSIASSEKFLQLNKLKEVGEVLEIINNLTVRLTTLTTQLKTFARKNKGPVELVDVGPSIQNAIDLFEAQIEETGIVIETMLGDNPVRIVSDPVKIEQVFVNLISNAIDAMTESDEKKLFIRMISEDGKVKIDVSDTGHGISEDHVTSLFSPFFTTKGFGEGVGLGLSIVYGIVSDMNGTITATNNKRGNGTTFSIELPLKQIRPEFAFGESHEN